jgi:hypothetical protein
MDSNLTKNLRQDLQDCQEFFLTIFQKKMVKNHRLRRKELK